MELFGVLQKGKQY
uniref:Uncharacterized protein n=1 Tax=Rhizophora mucronata TaxID=61149 RepID=A0A2P2NSQ7_RHIMU